MPRPRKRQREIEQTRTHILEAAARVFGDKGFAASSMQEIAEAAGYSAPSLYSYFKGKQAILDGLVAMIVEEASELFEVTLPPGMTLRQKIELLLRHQNAWAERYRDAFLFFVRRGPPPSANDEPPPDIAQSYVEQLSSWFEEHDGDNELSGHSLESVAYVLWGIQHAFFLRWVRAGAVASLSDSVPEVLDFFFNGVGPGPRRGTNAHD